MRYKISGYFSTKHKLITTHGFCICACEHLKSGTRCAFHMQCHFKGLDELNYKKNIIYHAGSFVCPHLEISIFKISATSPIKWSLEIFCVMFIALKMTFKNCCSKEQMTYRQLMIFRGPAVVLKRISPHENIVLHWLSCVSGKRYHFFNGVSNAITFHSPLLDWEQKTQNFCTMKSAWLKYVFYFILF